jgi:EAL domain-containing protein (putative c-di-GMP-specific phosphodiesterase class I)/GGDEF domain-containing protein
MRSGRHNAHHLRTEYIDVDAQVTAAEQQSESERLRAENVRLKSDKASLERRVAALERKLSLHPLSGLPTHFRLELELEELIDTYRRTCNKDGFTILIIQLGENYSAVRKTLKASVSEWILYQTGCRISSLLRDEDRVFHTRENEFVVILPNLKGEALGAFVRRLLPRLVEPHIFAGFNVSIGVSTGAAYWPEHGEERSRLMHHADIASGAAADGRKAFVLFRPALLQHAVEKIELQNSIIKAIEASALDRIGEQFFICFQPKLFARAIEGRTIIVERIEAEALIRWQHPEKGLLYPSTFVPLAEETGLILPLGKWLLYQCTRRLAAWAKSGRDDIGLSVNLSARQFKSEDTAKILETVLAHTGARPDLLTVELTETSLFEDTTSTAATLERFAALGVRVSVDDFGTGYSSLSHLHRFPLDEIKIDRLFVENITKNHQDRIIVRSLVSIAKGLDLELVAEGVEEPEALEMLFEMGCKGFQGYLISKGLPAKQFIAFRDEIVKNGMRFTF